MNKAIIAILLLIFPSTAEAAFTDFDDLPHLSRYFLGDTINSNGLLFDTVDLGTFPGGATAVDERIARPSNTYNSAGGTGVYLSFTRFGLDFPLLPGTKHVSLLYGVHTSNAATIILNGETANPTNGFIDLNGTTLGGVSITAAVGTAGYELQLNGPLNSLIVGGTEFTMDDVTIGIPEPSTATLLFAASISLLTTRRRRRA